MDYDGPPQIVGIMGLTVVLRMDGTGDWEQMAVIWAWLSRCIVTDLCHPVSFPRDGVFILDTESNSNPPATQPAAIAFGHLVFSLFVCHAFPSLYFITFLASANSSPSYVLFFILYLDLH